MFVFGKQISTLPRTSRLMIALLMAVLLVPVLAGCSGSKLDVYQSDLLKVKVPMLEGWEVQLEEAQSQEMAYMTLANEYSGVLVTRSSLAQIFPDKPADTKIEDYFNTLISLGQGSETFTTSGSIEIKPKSGYQQATVPVDLTEIMGIAGASKGTLLMTLEGDQTVIAIFFCTLEKLDECEKDLAASVKGFSLID